jgi:hypothetical protein
MWPPIADRRDLRLGSRYLQYWVLTSLARSPEDSQVRLAALDAVRATARDYRCSRPDIIIFIRFDRDPRTTNPHDDPFRFFTREPSFQALLAHYKLVDRYGAFDVYGLAVPLKPASPHLCRDSGRVAA